MMKRLIIITAAMAMFTVPVMAKGKINAKTADEEVVGEDIFANDGDEAHNGKADGKTAKVEIYFKNCREARAAGYSRMRTGQPGYASHLDRDNDGIACE